MIQKNLWLTILLSLCLTLTGCAEHKKPNEWRTKPIFSADRSKIFTNVPSPKIVDRNDQLIELTDSEFLRYVDYARRSSISGIFSSQYSLDDENRKFNRAAIVNKSSFEAHFLNIREFAWNPSWSKDNSQLAVYLPVHKQVGIFDATGHITRTYERSVPGIVADIIWSADQKSIFVVAPNSLEVIDTTTGKVTGIRVESELFYPSPDCTLIAIPTKDGFKIANVAIGTSRNVDLIRGPYEHFEWSPDGRFFFYGSRIGSVVDAKNLKTILEIKPTTQFTEVKGSWSHKGLLAVSGGDANVHIVDVGNAKTLLSLPNEQNGDNKVQWSPDSNRILVSDTAGRSAIYEASTGALVASADLPDMETTFWDTDTLLLTIPGLETNFLLPCKGKLAASILTRENPWSSQLLPHTLAECFAQMDKELPGPERECLKSGGDIRFTRYYVPIRLRSNWQLGSDSPISMVLKARGFVDSTDQEQEILRLYRLYLRQSDK